MKRIHEAVARSLRSAFFAATVAAGVLSLFGCRVEHAGPGTASEQVELTYWPAPNQQEVELADTLVRRWNALHPDIHVSMQPIPVSQSTEEVLLAAIAGKTTPDICANMQPAAMAEYYLRTVGRNAYPLMNVSPNPDGSSRTRCPSISRFVIMDTKSCSFCEARKRSGIW